MDLPFDKGDDYIGETGIPIQDTFWVLDSSKMQALMNCPRGFFFSHILGWQDADPNIHLVFGSAWHEAMEHLLRNGGDKQSVREAYEVFMETYEEEFASDPYHSEHYAKNPGNALEALAGYAGQFPINPRNTLWTEVAGTTPIREDRNIHFKVDTIRKHPQDHQEAGKYHILEHKTTSRKSQTWLEKWSYKFQVGTYLHTMHTWLEDPEDLDGLTINGSIFRKNDVEHIRIPVRKSGPQMMEYLYEANYWFSFYEEEMRKLAEAKPSDTYMEAFPRNTESCGKFGCNYPGICNARPNPLRDLTCPNGYETDFWDPRSRQDEAKNVLKLDESKEMQTNEGTQESDEQSNGSIDN